MNIGTFLKVKIICCRISSTENKKKAAFKHHFSHQLFQNLLCNFSTSLGTVFLPHCRSYFCLFLSAAIATLTKTDPCEFIALILRFQVVPFILFPPSFLSFEEAAGQISVLIKDKD